MSNDRLRAVLQHAGLQPEDLADQVDVDTRTVRRWLGGNVPSPRYRVLILQALSGQDVTEHDLWPDAAAPPDGDDSQDLVAIYRHGDDIRIPNWRDLLHAATQRIELLDTSLAALFLTTGTTGLLREKARAGATVRILTAHPHSIWLTSLADQLGDTHRDQDGHTRIDRDLALSHRAQEELIDEPNIDVRVHWAERANTLTRFDDEMLVTLNLYATPERQAPLMQLRRDRDDGLFDQFAGHFDQVWQHASQPLQAGLRQRPSTPA